MSANSAESDSETATLADAGSTPVSKTSGWSTALGTTGSAIGATGSALAATGSTAFSTTAGAS